MGLEGVEIVLAVEDEFQIAISNAEAEKSDTVGKVVDLVYSRLRPSTQAPCPSQQGFYRIRKQMMKQLAIPRSTIKPETLLEDLIPRENRREAWKELITALAGKEFSDTALQRPRWVKRLSFIALPGAMKITAKITMMRGTVRNNSSINRANSPC